MAPSPSEEAVISVELNLPPLKGKEVTPGITILEEPKMVDGELRALADVGGALCIIALKISMVVHHDQTPASVPRVS
jgi:hypothetical protein